MDDDLIPIIASYLPLAESNILMWMARLPIIREDADDVPPSRMAEFLLIKITGTPRYRVIESFKDDIFKYFNDIRKWADKYTKAVCYIRDMLYPVWKKCLAHYGVGELTDFQIGTINKRTTLNKFHHTGRPEDLFAVLMTRRNIAIYGGFIYHTIDENVLMQEIKYHYGGFLTPMMIDKLREKYDE